jgi:hypothetical protein
VRELNYQLKQLCRRNRDGSYRTQADRERQLTLIANQLQALGYRKMNAQSLKPKHVEALVKHWQGELSNRHAEPQGERGTSKTLFLIVCHADRGAGGSVGHHGDGPDSGVHPERDGKGQRHPTESRSRQSPIKFQTE